MNPYTTSASLYRSSSTAEKSQAADTGSTDDAAAEAKDGELSPKEKELLAENEKLLETVRNLDVSFIWHNSGFYCIHVF